MMTTTALVLALATCVRPPMPSIEPLAPEYPSFVGTSDHAVIARPLAIKYFEDHATRYWRAQYQVVAWAGRSVQPHKPEKIVVEWSCDPKGDGEDPCGELIDRVLPGFESGGRTDVAFVQLELRYKNASTFDGVELYYAARDGSQRLQALDHHAIYEGLKARG